MILIYMYMLYVYMCVRRFCTLVGRLEQLGEAEEDAAAGDGGGKIWAEDRRRRGAEIKTKQKK
ncbi:hypothetical protein Hanom_Chr10g00964761 [Helianthus anomalus]